MKDTQKPFQDLERIAEVVEIPESESRLAEAREFMDAVMKRKDHFTKYSINVEYGKDGVLNSLELKLYFTGDSAFGHRTEEFSSSTCIYKRS